MSTVSKASSKVDREDYLEAKEPGTKCGGDTFSEDDEGFSGASTPGSDLQKIGGRRASKKLSGSTPGRPGMKGAISQRLEEDSSSSKENGWWIVDAMRDTQAKESQTAPSKAVQTFLTEKVEEVQEKHGSIPSSLVRPYPQATSVMNGTPQSLKTTLDLEEVRKTVHATKAAGWEEGEQAKYISRTRIQAWDLSSSCQRATNKTGQPTHWMATSIAINLVLLLSYLLPKDYTPGPAHVKSTPGCSSGILAFSATATPASNPLPCSGRGYLKSVTDGSLGTCKCHACYGGADCSKTDGACVIDLDHGDPTMFESYWFANGDSSTAVILGWQRMSYFAQSQHVWFMEHQLEEQIRSLHRLVGNAVTEGRHIVVGTGSTQLFQAALYALTTYDQTSPASVVSAAPFYSSYPVVTDYLRSGLFKWAGDAAAFKQSAKSDAYIELVTSPNNPDGKVQQAIVNGSGPVVHDLAYYWPHYTPITEPANHDLMLFTLSKSTGHAGTRIGWAILRDEKVAKKMTKFIELNTIGVSQDSQVRSTQILKAVLEGYSSGNVRLSGLPAIDSEDAERHIQHQKLFHHGYSVLHYRWSRLRAALASSSSFVVSDFTPACCTFFGETTTPTPAFAWLRCNKVADCQAFLKERNIITRSGRHFGAGPEYVRLSMLDRSHSFEILVDRLASMASSAPD